MAFRPSLGSTKYAFRSLALTRSGLLLLAFIAVILALARTGQCWENPHSFLELLMQLPLCDSIFFQQHRGECGQDRFVFRQ